MPLCVPYPGGDDSAENQTETMEEQPSYVLDTGGLDANWTLSGNFSSTPAGNVTLEVKREPWISINELQMIKVVVLVVVVGILLLSTCRIVFRTFSRYTGKKGDGD